MCLLFPCVINLSLTRFIDRCGIYLDACYYFGGFASNGDELGQRLGVFQVVHWMMDLIGAELTCASYAGRMGARFLPYHCNVREYLCLAVHVMRVCQGQLGNVDALTFVSRSVGRAAISGACAFVRGFCNLDKMGLCPIFQDTAHMPCHILG